MPWPSDGAVEKASTAGPNNGVAIFYPITELRENWFGPRREFLRLRGPGKCGGGWTRAAFPTEKPPDAMVVDFLRPFFRRVCHEICRAARRAKGGCLRPAVTSEANGGRYMRQKSVFRVYLRLAVVRTTCVHALVTATALCRAGLWGAQKRTGGR